MKWFTRCLAVLAVLVAGATVASPLWAMRPNEDLHMAGYLAAPNVCSCPRLVGSCSCIVSP
mgnify:CR=1 FL=1